MRGLHPFSANCSRRKKARNKRTWADKNARSFLETLFQQKFEINDPFLGAYELLPRQFIWKITATTPTIRKMAANVSIHDGIPSILLAMSSVVWPPSSPNFTSAHF
jgi:hypothetical protein